jgi:hypothetical protein
MDRSDFIEPPPQSTTDSSTSGVPANGIASITRHRIRG